MLQNKEENLREELLRFLLQWNYDNFAYYRRQSLKNVMDACLGYKDTGPELFKQKLDDYFRLDEFTLDIEKLLEANAYESIQFARRKIAPNNQINPITEIEKTQNVLARYLESQKDNPGLDLLSGMCRLVTNKFDDADGASRLVNFIKISQKDTDYWADAFEDLLKFVSKLEVKYKDQFSAEVCPYLENRLDLVKVHEYLNDDFSAIAYLEQYNKQLERVV